MTVVVRIPFHSRKIIPTPIPFPFSVQYLISIPIFFSTSLLPFRPISILIASNNYTENS